MVAIFCVYLVIHFPQAVSAVYLNSRKSHFEFIIFDNHFHFVMLYNIEISLVAYILF